jgi:hypothetical protein
MISPLEHEHLPEPSKFQRANEPTTGKVFEMVVLYCSGRVAGFPPPLPTAVQGSPGRVVDLVGAGSLIRASSVDAVTVLGDLIVPTLYCDSCAPAWANLSKPKSIEAFIHSDSPPSVRRHSIMRRPEHWVLTDTNVR